MRNRPAYPIRIIKRKRKVSNGAPGVLQCSARLKNVCSLIGSLDWTGLASFLLPPSAAARTVGWSTGDGKAATLCPHRMLYSAVSIIELPWPSSRAKLVSSRMYKAMCRGCAGKWGTATLLLAQARHRFHPFEYLDKVLGALEANTNSNNWGTCL